MIRGGKRKREAFSQVTELFEKEVCRKRTIHPTVGGFSVEAGSSNGSTSATLNVLEPDIEDHSPRESLVTSLQQWVEDNYPRESVTSTSLQQDDYEHAHKN